MMNSQNPQRPRMLMVMNTVTMPVGELTRELERLAVGTSRLSFVQYSSDVFASNEYDVRISGTGADVTVDVAEPECGQPVLTSNHDGGDSQWQEVKWLIQAIDYRRNLLASCMNALRTHHPEFPVARHSVRLPTLADECDLHVTIVAKTLDNKICLTPNGPVSCRDFVR